MKISHLVPSLRYPIVVAAGFAISCVTPAISAQQATLPSPLTWTADQDHQNMMSQLGIKALRPGPSGDEKAPNHANYDDAKANPYPNLPDVLTLKNGQKVTTPAAWWNQRRPEIAEDMEREVYGRLPKNLPGVKWTVSVTDRELVGRIPVIARKLVGHVDNSAYPLIDVNIEMTVVLPTNARGPVPILMMFGPARLPAPAQPPAEDLDKINAALRAMLSQSDPGLKAVLEKYPAYSPIASQAVNPFAPRPVVEGDPPTQEQLIADGWGYAAINPASIQADNGAGITRGIIGLVNKGQARKPDDWGALRAWSWGAARGLDYLETDPAIDAKHVGIEGVSRYGKAALVTLAFEPRFAVGLIGLLWRRRSQVEPAQLGRVGREPDRW